MPKASPPEHRKLTDFTPDPHNANAGTERGVRVLSDSLAETGFGRSIVVDKHGVVIAGNKTLERAVDQGFTDAIVVKTRGDQLVVVQREDMDIGADDPNNAARKLAYYDNRAGEVGLAWDADTIARDVAAGVTLDTMFSEDELAAILNGVTPDLSEGDASALLNRAEALQREYGVERGQLWTMGKHRLYCGDSYSLLDIERLLQNERPDMLHTDPPYGINIVQPKNGDRAADSGGAKPFGSTASNERKGATAVAKRNSGKVGGGTGALVRQSRDVGRSNPANIIQSNIYPVIEGDDHPFDPLPFLDIAPVTILWGANYYADKLPSSSGWICWDKREALTRNNFADCELAWTNQAKPSRVFYHLWNGLHKGSQHGQRRIHPTEKPVALFEEIGQMYCPSGLWLDLFAGSGAQVEAAHRHGATCYALEYEPLYVACILQRMKDIGLTPHLET